jgi:DNA-binding MarR family transcriptional regulator
MAVELERAIQRLRARIRSEAGLDATPWSRSQLLVLDRLAGGPPMTTSDLAAAEHVRPQSMAATLAPLEHAKLVARHRDPEDGRRVLFSATVSGRSVVGSVLAKRNAWLASAIDHELTAADLEALPPLIQLLDRLADCCVPPVARRPGIAMRADR